MLDIHWIPVGVVLAVVTGVASLATLDLLTVIVVTVAFILGVLVGRESFRRDECRVVDGGNGE